MAKKKLEVMAPNIRKQPFIIILTKNKVTKNVKKAPASSLRPIMKYAQISKSNTIKETYEHNEDNDVLNHHTLNNGIGNIHNDLSDVESGWSEHCQVLLLFKDGTTHHEVDQFGLRDESIEKNREENGTTTLMRKKKKVLNKEKKNNA